MATTNLGVYRNAIKPVGEQIVVDFVNSATITAGNDVTWDYDIPANLVVTDLLVVKTGTASAAGTTFQVQVIRVEDDGTETVIVQTAAAAWTLGQVIRPTAMFAAGTAGSLESRLTAVASQSLGATATANSQQALRIKVLIAVDNAVAGEAACLIKVSLARFSSVQSKFDEVVTVQS